MKYSRDDKEKVLEWCGWEPIELHPSSEHTWRKNGERKVYAPTERNEFMVYVIVQRFMELGRNIFPQAGDGHVDIMETTYCISDNDPLHFGVYSVSRAPDLFTAYMNAALNECRGES